MLGLCAYLACLAEITLEVLRGVISGACSWVGAGLHEMRSIRIVAKGHHHGHHGSCKGRERQEGVPLLLSMLLPVGIVRAA